MNNANKIIKANEYNKKINSKRYKIKSFHLTRTKFFVIIDCNVEIHRTGYKSTKSLIRWGIQAIIWKRKELCLLFLESFLGRIKNGFSLNHLWSSSSFLNLLSLLLRKRSPEAVASSCCRWNHLRPMEKVPCLCWRLLRQHG